MGSLVGIGFLGFGATRLNRRVRFIFSAVRPKLFEPRNTHVHNVLRPSVFLAGLYIYLFLVLVVYYYIFFLALLFFFLENLIDPFEI